MTAFEVGGDNRSILLLSCGVPDIQLGWFVLESNVFDFEVDCCYLRLLFG
jgi:hypothetical protein